jgi:3-phenylpropionate/trans-cinnamate dioxygenase ferredoxin subunit
MSNRVDKHVVARVADVPDGGRIIVEVGGRSIGIFNVGGEFFGLLNRCPHKGAQMCKGNIVGRLSADAPGSYEYDPASKLIMCPWHGWEFDIRSGQSYFDPRGTRLRTYDVEVEGGDIVAGDLDSGSTAMTPAQYAAANPSALAHENGLAPGPYQAETIPITVEDDYLVVNLRPPRPARRPRAEAVT